MLKIFVPETEPAKSKSDYVKEWLDIRAKEIDAGTRGHWDCTLSDIQRQILEHFGVKVSKPLISLAWQEWARS
jgi:hypothetical protein